MGGVKFVPNLDSIGPNDEWYELLGGEGKIKIGYSFKPQTVCSFLPSAVNNFLTQTLPEHLIVH